MKKVEDKKEETKEKVSEKTEAFKSFSEHIEGLTREELIRLILGDKDTAPIKLNRDEPTFSRPQLIWAMKKYNKEYLENKEAYDSVIDESLDCAESQVETIIQFLEGANWNSFYNYDWVRFDIKKPGFYWFLAGLVSLCYVVAKLITFIIKLF